MTKKKRKISPVDIHDQNIRDSAIGYKIIFFQTGSSVRESKFEKELERAKETAEHVLSTYDKYRCVIIYAFDKQQQHAMVGHYDSKLNWKEVVLSS